MANELSNEINDDDTKRLTDSSEDFIFETLQTSQWTHQEKFTELNR